MSKYSLTSKLHNQSRHFTDSEFAQIRALLDQYKTIYGVGSVVTSKKGDRKLAFSPTQKLFMIPEFNSVKNNYFTCKHYAWEGFMLFQKLKLPFIKSFAFIWGSDDRYNGHCVLVLSKFADPKLLEFNGCHDKGNGFIDWFLHNHCLIFDICRGQVLDYADAKFKAKTIFYCGPNYYGESDSILNAEPHSFAMLGDVEGYTWGFCVDEYNRPNIYFSSLTEECFHVYSNDDVVKYSAKKPKLFSHSDLQSTIAMFYDMEIISDVNPLASKEPVWIRI
jgi:hypothetical protein